MNNPVVLGLKQAQVIALVVLIAAAVGMVLLLRRGSRERRGLTEPRETR